MSWTVSICWTRTTAGEATAGSDLGRIREEKQYLLNGSKDGDFRLSVGPGRNDSFLALQGRVF
jgi:hypothetical protein